MWHSIQEISRKINSHLSWFDLISLGVTLVFLCGFTLYCFIENKKSVQPLLYKAGEQREEPVMERPFASKNGTTYTFSWCQGASRIKEENKIFFNTETEATQSGRTLSKLCQR